MFVSLLPKTSPPQAELGQPQGPAHTNSQIQKHDTETRFPCRREKRMTSRRCALHMHTGKRGCAQPPACRLGSTANPTGLFPLIRVFRNQVAL